MNVSKWLEIEADYETAKICLWCPHDAMNWHRDEEKGYYHLWKAYYAAIQEEEKQNLLYARILIMMSDEDRANRFNNYTCFHRYIAPAKKAYDKAIENNEITSSEEYESLTRKYEYLEYMLGLEEWSDDSYSLINGLDKIKEFYFHDAKPKRFEVIEDSAELDIQLYDVVSVRLKFKNIFDIQVSTDPICDYINEFYCYRNFDIPERIVFDIGFYKIVCEEITVEKI